MSSMGTNASLRFKRLEMCDSKDRCLGFLKQCEEQFNRISI